MSSDSGLILERFRNLKTYRSGDRRAPHKPLLVLISLAKFQQGQNRISYNDATSMLLPLLQAYAPSVKGRHQPELPYWHLQSDNLWEVDGANELPRQVGGFPRLAGLQATSAGLTQDVLDAISLEPYLSSQIIDLLLNEHFPPSIHEDLIAQVGINLSNEGIGEPVIPYQGKRRRNPYFRESVLRAYEHRCALTGFRAALSGTYFGCEAAHVQWHAHDGPDNVENGICLEPTVHKLLDAGAWTLTDDHRILVSMEYTGSETAEVRLREHHGRSLGNPIAGEPLVSVEYIRWHREAELGGVFRSPAIAL